MPLETRTLTTATAGQDGFFLVNWDDTTAGISLSAAVPAANIGLVFDLGLQVNGNGRALDQPGVKALSLTMNLINSNAIGVGLVEVWAVPGTAQANFSDALPPFGRGELLLGAFEVDWQTVEVTGTCTLGTYLTAGNALTPTCAQNFQTLRMLSWGSALWSGRIALSLLMVTGGVLWIFESAETGGTNPPTLTATTYPAWNGLTGGPTGPRQRFVRDSRFGMPMLNTEVVRDGDNSGLWVRASDQDPKDPPNTYRPKPGEGSVDDDVSTD